MMKLFSYTYLQFRKLALFFLLLVLLLVFNLYYNMNFSWAGVALIVRMYVYVFSFFLVYNYTMEEDYYNEKYSEKFGRFGSVFFIFESRIFLFFLLLVISSIFRITEYSGATDWPFKYILSIFDGKSSNLIFFTLAFFIALKLMRHPVLTVTLFLGISTLYTYANTVFYNNYENGIIISGFKILKMVVLFIIINFSYCRKKYHYFMLLLSSVLLAFFIWLSCFYVYFLIYQNSVYGDSYFRYSAEKLIKFGYEKPIDDYLEIIRKYNDIEYLLNLDHYKKSYDISFNFTQSEWTDIFLKSSSGPRYNEISKIILNEGIVFGMDVVEKSIAVVDLREYNLKKFNNYVNLLAKSVNETNAERFMQMFVNSDPQFTRFGISVCGKSGVLYFIPQLLVYLVSVDDDISEAAYSALVEITGADVAKQQNLPQNSPDVYMYFKKFYLDNYSL